MSNKNRIVWHAPKWSVNADKRWLELKKCLLAKGPIIRISIASMVATGLIVLGLKIALPGIVIPNLLPLLLVYPMLMGNLAIQTYFSTLVSPTITVTATKIFISQGQSATTIPTDQLTSVVLAIHDDNKSRLRLRYQRRGKSRLKIIGMPWEVSLLELEKLLAIKITPRDYRRKSQEQLDQQNQHDSSESSKTPAFDSSGRTDRISPIPAIADPHGQYAK